MEPSEIIYPRHSPSLHIEVVDNELCIYDWTTQRVHALNAPAARVWPLCDGTRTTAQIAEVLRNEFGDGAHGVVSMALDEFAAAGLLATNRPVKSAGVSRRSLMRKLGLTAAMLPVVSSIVAPSKIQAASGNSQTFGYTGGAQTFTVPVGVAQISIEALGAAGGPSTGSVTVAGLGGRVMATISVTPLEALTVVVGGQGIASFVPSNPGAPGGFNGGGDGNGALGGGGGGGASDLRRGSTKLVIAGGGGGAGRHVNGGGGGGLTGVAGDTDPGNGGGGGGGTQTAGGAGGAAGVGGSPGGNGSLGQGGSGTGPLVGAGGGGGGGYYGGGAGGGSFPALLCGGGGGGSSYTDPAAMSVLHTQGIQGGFGLITLAW